MLTAVFTCLFCVPGAAPIELIADAKFQAGFTTIDREGKEQLVRWHAAAALPVWKVAQHYSKSSLAQSDRCLIRRDGLFFRDDYQVIDVHPATSDADLILGVNGFQEFGGRYRQQGDPWPHLLVEQPISAPGGHLAEKMLRLPDLARLDWAIAVRLLYDHAHQGPGYNPHLHAAQFTLHFTVQNLNRHSSGYGDYYWFGVGFYDSRYAVTSLFAMQDKGSDRKKGTDNFIYNVGIAPFTSAIVGQGQWVTVRGDLLPHIRAGLQEAWKRGYLAGSKDPADYAIGGMNMGWEITGLNDASMAVKDFSAAATLQTK